MQVTFAQLLADLKTLENPFPLDQGLGETILDSNVIEIDANCRSEVDVEGIPWARLSAQEQKRKNLIAPGQPIGKLYGLMLAQDQIIGTRTITVGMATMTYGRTDAAKIEATKFQEGGAVTGTNQPERSFYGISQAQTAFADNAFTTRFQTFLI